MEPLEFKAEALTLRGEKIIEKQVGYGHSFSIRSANLMTAHV